MCAWFAYAHGVEKPPEADYAIKLFKLRGRHDRILTATITIGTPV
jgi:hypothetical protein